MKKLILLSIFISIFFISCDKDSLLQENKAEVLSINEIEVKNGRLYFPNKTTFTAYYNSTKEKEDNQIAEELEEKFYVKNFYSLVPIVSEKSNTQMLRHLDKYKELNIPSNSGELRQEDVLEHFDDLEEILGEDVFQSFLNENAEIQVNDTIYKYTDKGILYTNEQYVNEIYSFMASHNVKSLSDIQNIDTSGAYPSFNQDGGVKSVTEHIDSYLARLPPIQNDNNGDGGSGYSGNSGSDSNNNVITSNEELNDIINNLEICNPSSPILGNIFGTVKVCIDSFGGAQRVKTKYYNVDFLLAFAIGVKVKHQHKTWYGLWERQTTDEVALGINSITWYFNHSKVFENTSYSSVTNFYTIHEDKYYRSLNSYTNAVYMGQNVPLPNLPFAETVDIIIETVNNSFGTSLTEQQVRTFFFEQLFNQAKSLLQAQGREMKKVGVIINQNGQTIVQYYDFQKRCTNCSKLEKVFDWGIATPKMTYTFGAGSGFQGSFGFTSIEFDFKHPDVTHLNVYGVAKRSGAWHGSRMIF